MLATRRLSDSSSNNNNSLFIILLIEKWCSINAHLMPTGDRHQWLHHDKVMRRVLETTSCYVVLLRSQEKLEEIHKGCWVSDV